MQVSVVPDPPVLAPRTTTPLEVRFRPVVVGSSVESLRLECAELGLYEWQLCLGGSATVPERSIGFSVPLGSRDTQARARFVCLPMYVFVMRVLGYMQ